jgi:integrase
MAIRKREWTTSRGERREAWNADYVDQQGDRHIKTFERKKDAEEYLAATRVDVCKGVHTAPSKSGTVKQAAKDWIAYAEGEGLERATIAGYRQMAAHIEKRIGHRKLSDLTKPEVNKLRDELLADMSRYLARKVLTSLKAILKDAERRGNVAQNVAHGVTIRRREREKRKLAVGIDIPTVEEVQRIIAEARDPWRPLLLTAIFTGLRASELRGLRWEDVDLKKTKPELHVRQRADRYGQIGPPKSAAGQRTLPLPPMLTNTLKEWKLKCPPSKLGLVFPTRTGKVHCHKDLLEYALIPTVKRAGLLDAEGKPKYTGMHALRHFYASRCINRRADGGLELPGKMVQERMGHESIVITMDLDGHLFPRGDDDGAEAAAEAALHATN